MSESRAVGAEAVNHQDWATTTLVRIPRQPYVSRPTVLSDADQQLRNVRFWQSRYRSWKATRRYGARRVRQAKAPQVSGQQDPQNAEQERRQLEKGGRLIALRNDLDEVFFLS